MRNAVRAEFLHRKAIPGRTTRKMAPWTPSPAPAARVALPGSADRCACGGGCPRCGGNFSGQPLLSQPGDPLEREADDTADRVMRSPASAQPRSTAPMARARSPDITRLPAGVTQTLRGPGEPLGGAVRTMMESRFGLDFSPVRIFRGAQAEQSAEAVNARAYTVGNNVVFGPGQYAPGSPAGQRLIAHELAHVARQNEVPGGASGQSLIQRDGKGAPTAVDDIVVWHYINGALNAHQGSVFGAWIELSASRDESSARAADPNLAAAEHYMYARFLAEDTPLPSFFVADMAMGYGAVKDFMRDTVGVDPSFSNNPTTKSTDSQKKFGNTGAFDGSWVSSDSWLTKIMESFQGQGAYYDF